MNIIIITNNIIVTIFQKGDVFQYMEISKKQIVETCPDISVSTIEKALNEYP